MHERHVSNGRHAGYNASRWYGLLTMNTGNAVPPAVTVPQGGTGFRRETGTRPCRPRRRRPTELHRRHAKCTRHTGSMRTTIEPATILEAPPWRHELHAALHRHYPDRHYPDRRYPQPLTPPPLTLPLPPEFNMSRTP